MKIVENEKKSWLSGKAVFSLFVSLILCSILIRIAIVNRTNIEVIKLEHLILEKTLKTNEVISRQLYRIQTHSVIAIQGNGEPANFDRLANAIIEEDPIVLSVIIAPDGVVADVYPREGNEHYFDMNFFSERENERDILAVMEFGAFLLDGPYNLPQGRQALLAKIPIHVESVSETKKFWGVISVFLSLPEALAEAELDKLKSEGFSYELFKINADTGEKQVIMSDIEHNLPKKYPVESHIQIYNADWYLHVFPVQMWYSYPENLILVAAGIFLSFIIFFIMQNNNELKRMRVVYETMANIDVLTGIYNRRYIEENLRPIISTVSRAGGEISFLMIDVDFFKKYNDTYGHGKGDSCLKTIASALAQTLFREEDFVARYGGEEFLVVLPLCHEKGAHKVAVRLLENVREIAIPHENSDVADHVTISVGVTTGMAEHARSGSEYLKKADEALYLSKKNGRNNYTFLSFP